MTESGGNRIHKKGGGGGNGFQSLGLSEVVYRGIVRMGFRTPTPVQRKALPVVLSGVDSVVMARTGSGKTCAFLIPLLEKLLTNSGTIASTINSNGGGARGIILSPTRELSQQTLRVLQKLIMDTELKAIGIHGAESMEKQFDLLSSKPDIIVATPGRLAHHLSEIPEFTLQRCQMCILDEADRLIEMGFGSQIREIARSLPEASCQKVLLSATMPKVLVEFTKSGFATDPAIVRLDSEATVSDELRIAFLTCRSLDKDAALLHVLQLIREQQQQSSSSSSASTTGLTLIFAATRHHVEYLTTLLNTSGVPATLIYGTLDQSARQQNLSAFRSGATPVLVVTDVAARGIDVPLIDHVIHYHFPSSPKLFVHRSGRAARAGRIGYCWGLVEPDELPYMMDLHLFLGRKPQASKEAYTLAEMTPEMVHYGSVPESVVTEEVENVQRLLTSELSGSAAAETLRALTKVCQNGMKQYRKTRSEASREGVRRAKAILEGERLESGERLNRGSVPPHPLLRAVELRRQTAAQPEAMEDLEKRQEFLRAMAAFRPKETVFEAFATGKSKETGVVSHIDKGRTTNSNKSKKHDSSAALSAMKDMRRQMRMIRDKGSTLVIAGSSQAREINGEVDVEENLVFYSDEKLEKCEVVTDEVENDAFLIESMPVSEPIHEVEWKRRLSKAERRRMRKNPDIIIDSDAATKKSKQGRDFRDVSFFIDNDLSANTDEAHRSRIVEASMQSNSSSAARGTIGRALRIEETMLDLVGDENDDMIKKQRMMRWDKTKRKYIQTTVGEELKAESKTKKLRLESGQLVKGDKLKLGDLYQKWQKKTNRSIGRTGVFDDNDDPAPSTSIATTQKKKRGCWKSGGVTKRSDDGGEKARSSTDIKKERERKQNIKIKNMKKGDRRLLEQKQRNSGSAKGKSVMKRR